MRKCRKGKHRKQTEAPPDNASIPGRSTPNHRSRRASSMSDYPMSFYSANFVDHANPSCMLVAMPVHENCSHPVCQHCTVRTGRVTGPHAHSRECSSALPEDFHPQVARQPPVYMRQRSYSDGQLANSFQIQRLEETRPDVHHYDVPRCTSSMASNNEWIQEVPRVIQHTSELDSTSTGVQSNRPLISAGHNGGLGSECGT